MGKVKDVKCRTKIQDQRCEDVKSHIDPVDITMLDDIHAKSKVDKNGKGKLINKRNRRIEKRKHLLAKLQSFHISQQDLKRKEKFKSVIFGDLKPLEDSLPQSPESSPGMQHMRVPSSMTNKKKVNNITRRHWKTRKNGELDDMRTFQSVLKLSEYKSDPLGAISNHIEYLKKAELV